MNKKSRGARLSGKSNEERKLSPANAEGIRHLWNDLHWTYEQIHEATGWGDATIRKYTKDLPPHENLNEPSEARVAAEANTSLLSKEESEENLVAQVQTQAAREGSENAELKKDDDGSIPQKYVQWLVADAISDGCTSWEEFFEMDLIPGFRTVKLLKEAVPWDRNKPEQFLTNLQHLLEVGLVESARRSRRAW